MSAENTAAGSSDGTANERTEPVPEGEGQSQLVIPSPDVISTLQSASLPSSSSQSAVDLPRKRKGDMEDRKSLVFEMEEELSRSNGGDQQVKMKCFREPHSQIEKRRRDKMNNLIDDLAAMIPGCNPMARKLDKLTVLRMAVQHLKTLKVGPTSAFTDTTYKPSFLPEDDLKHLVLRAADGFLIVVSCDRGKILFTSESVSNILNFSRVSDEWKSKQKALLGYECITRWNVAQPITVSSDAELELIGQSIFDYIYHKDISKVKEQLSAPDLLPLERLIDAKTGLQVQADLPAETVHMCTGARRSFFCRMKDSRVAGKPEDKHSLPGSSKKKDSHRYTTVHCSGYMRSWSTAQLDVESDTEKGNSHLTCLVAVCRVHPHISPQPSKEIKVKPTEFVTRCAIDGKFTFVDQQATTIIGYLPQELLGTSCYEYFHQDDLQHLAERHRKVLRSKEKIETNCYKFKTKRGSFVTLQSQWFSFINPWTKEVEFIVSINRVLSGPSHTKEDKGEQPGISKALEDDSKPNLPIIPGISSGTATMIYAGSIGTQIANELIDSMGLNSSPSSGAASPFAQPMERSPLITPPQTIKNVLSREDAPSRSGSQSESSKAALTSSETPAETGGASQLDLDCMGVPGLSNLSSDEAAMAVIMSLLETDTNMGDTVDFEDIHWSL